MRQCCRILLRRPLRVSYVCNGGAQVGRGSTLTTGEDLQNDQGEGELGQRGADVCTFEGPALLNQLTTQSRISHIRTVELLGLPPAPIRMSAAKPGRHCGGWGFGEPRS